MNTVREGKAAWVGGWGGGRLEGIQDTYQSIQQCNIRSSVLLRIDYATQLHPPPPNQLYHRVVRVSLPLFSCRYATLKMNFYYRNNVQSHWAKVIIRVRICPVQLFLQSLFFKENCYTTTVLFTNTMYQTKNNNLNINVLIHMFNFV